MAVAVSFRLMLFAPFVGEVLVGKVMSTCRSYIRGACRLSRTTDVARDLLMERVVSLGFFRDVYITPSCLPQNSALCVDLQSDPDSSHPISPIDRGSHICTLTFGQ